MGTNLCKGRNNQTTRRNYLSSWLWWNARNYGQSCHFDGWSQVFGNCERLIQKL